MEFELSVVVCSYKRHRLLQKTINHFGHMHQSSSGIEYIVVENSPTKDRVGLRLPDHFHSRLVICEQTGLSHARNAGIEAAQGKIIAFLDDDSLVCRDWANLVIQTFQQKGNTVLGGRVTPKFMMDRLPAWFYMDLAGYLSCIDWGGEPRMLHPGEWIVGANMAFKREIFSQYGMFDPNLGRSGEGSLISNDETGLLEKIGIGNIFYSPVCTVEHIIQPERIRLEWFRKRVFWQAVSDALTGISFQTPTEMDDEYRTIAAQLPGRYRNLNMFTFEPSSAAEFKLQLRAIYLSARLGGAGYRIDDTTELRAAG